VVGSGVLCKKDGEKYKYYLPMPQTGEKNSEPCQSRAQYRERKKKKKAKWLVSDVLQPIQINGQSAFEPEDLFIAENTFHNKINRIVGSTTGGEFSPFQTSEICFSGDVFLSVVVIVDTNVLPLNEFLEVFKAVGRYGFGRDASVGKGRFEVVGHKEASSQTEESLFFYTLSPLVADESNSISFVSFSPFVRFGKHGNFDGLINPYKNPILMAKEGAIVKASEENKSQIQKYGFIGQGLRNLSTVRKETVAQGYAPCVSIIL
jgi:CRISPR-associated protein Csm4